jgi:hypothetical protein
MSTGKTEEEAKKQAPIIIEAGNASKWGGRIKTVKALWAK